MKFFLLVGLIFVILIASNYILSWKERIEISLSKVYLINLAKSKDRFENAKVTLDKEGIKFERFDATYGMDVEIEDVQGKVFFGRDLAEKKKRFEDGKTYFIKCDEGFKVKYVADYSSKKPYKNVMKRPLLAGEIGCLCSHLRIYKEIIGKNLDYALIFEDDFSISSNFKNKLERILKKLPKDFDIYYLTSNHVNFKVFVWFKFLKKLLPDVNYCLKHRGFASMASYIITQDAARKIVSHVEENGIENLPIDDLITRYLMPKLGLNLYVNGKNNLVFHGKRFQSEIDSQGKR